MTNHGQWWVLFCLSAVLGCGGSTELVLGAEEAEGETDDALRLSPDAGESLARLTVKLPTGSCTAGGSCGRPLARNPVLQLDGVTIALGSEQRVVRGPHRLTVDGVPHPLTLNAGQRKNVSLPVARRRCTADTLPTVEGTDFGATPVVTNHPCPTRMSSAVDGGVFDPFASGGTLSWYYQGGSCTQSFFAGWTRSQLQSSCGGWAGYTITGVSGPGGACVPVNVNANTLCRAVLAGDYSLFTPGAALEEGDLAYAPGAYTYSFPGQTTGTRVTLAEGSLRELEIRQPVVGQAPALFTTTLVLDEPRELADAVATTVTSSVSGERNYTLPANARGTVTLKAYVNTAATYTLTVGGRQVTLDQTQANRVVLKRLDVDDVAVTREDNTTYLQRGTFEVYFGGTRITGPHATNTGVDLLPGDYEVVIQYGTAEGEQVQRHTVTL